MNNLDKNIKFIKKNHARLLCIMTKKIYDNDMEKKSGDAG